MARETRYIALGGGAWMERSSTITLALHLHLTSCTTESPESLQSSTLYSRDVYVSISGAQKQLVAVRVMHGFNKISTEIAIYAIIEDHVCRALRPIPRMAIRK